MILSKGLLTYLYFRSLTDMAEIWKHFKKLPADAGKAQCTRCLQILMCKGSSTSGLLRHLQIKHNILCKRQAQPINDQQHGTGPSSSKVCSMMNYVKRRNLNEEVARLAAKDGFSVNGITKSEFIRQSRLPTSNNTVMKLNEAKVQTVLEIRNRMDEGQSVSITLDEWTNLNNKRYMNINTHFMDGDMINLGLVLVNGSLPAEKIVEAVKGALKDFEVKSSNVFGATTGAAAVMVKFGKTSGYWHQLCYNHGIHLAVCDVIYKKNPREPVVEDDSEDDDDDDEDGDVEEAAEGDIEDLGKF